MSESDRADDPIQLPALRLPYRYAGLRIVLSDHSRTVLEERIGNFVSHARFRDLIDEAERLLTIYAYSVSHYLDQATLNYRIWVVTTTYENLAFHIRNMTPHVATRFVLHSNQSNPRAGLEEYERHIKGAIEALADTRDQTRETGRIAIKKLNRWLVSALIWKWGVDQIRASNGRLPGRVKDPEDAGRAYVVSVLSRASKDASHLDIDKFPKEREALLKLKDNPSAKTIQRLIEDPDPLPKREPQKGRDASGGRRPSHTIRQEHLDKFHRNIKSAVDQLHKKSRVNDQ